MFFQKIKKTKHTQVSSIRGFSLIEMMVSLSVFSIVMTISIGTLLIMVDANAKAQALYSSTTNLSFALDSMTREMRMGYHYYCPISTLASLSASDTDNCVAQQSIAFIRERDGRRVGYRFNATNNSIEQNIGPEWVRITSEDVIIETFDITVINSNPYDQDGDGDGDVQPGYKDQPVVNLTIKGRVDNGLDTATDFNIQTRIVQLSLDIF